MKLTLLLPPDFPKEPRNYQALDSYWQRQWQYLKGKSRAASADRSELKRNDGVNDDGDGETKRQLWMPK